jgi:hypothetical protein
VNRNNQNRSSSSWTLGLANLTRTWHTRSCRYGTRAAREVRQTDCRAGRPGCHKARGSRGGEVTGRFLEDCCATPTGQTRTPKTKCIFSPQAGRP